MADRLYRWTLRLSVGAVAFFVFLWAIVLWPLEAMLIGELISNHHPPPVAGGVITSDDGGRSDVVDSKLTVALQKQFPVGTAGAALRSVLLRPTNHDLASFAFVFTCTDHALRHS